MARRGKKIFSFPTWRRKLQTWTDEEEDDDDWDGAVKRGNFGTQTQCRLLCCRSSSTPHNCCFCSHSGAPLPNFPPPLPPSHNLNNNLFTTCRCSRASVTRFGEITPLWWNSKRFGQLFEWLFIYWQNFKPSLAISFVIGQIFAVINSQKLMK